MRYIALATDYDGTLASDGKVSDSTIAALEQVKASGRKLILVTGRQLTDLKNVFPGLGVFHRLVVENGALLYDPQTREETLLCDPPPAALVSLLRERQVPFDVGRAIIATWEPHEKGVIEAIRELGLDNQVIFNKHSVMVLPSGMNKASGLAAALKSLELSPHNVVAVGDAENDHPLLAFCECGVAVANALPALKERADVVMEKDHGAGVEELIAQLLEDDLQRYDDRLRRHAILLGTKLGNENDEVRLNPSRHSILVAGASASGKSTAVAGMLERLQEHDYQFCLVDPEGDFENFAGALTFGTPKERPDTKAVMNALQAPDRSIVVSLLGVPMPERPQYFAELLPSLVELRAQKARPHWIIIDEAHHMLPTSWSPASSTLPQALGGTILVTVHPEHISRAALEPVDTVITTGPQAKESMDAFSQAMQIEPATAKNSPQQSGEALVWFRNQGSEAMLVKTQAAKAERRRHKRQYSEGELSPEQSFYFRGPKSKLNLRAQNLTTFLQMADGVDDETWLFHLRNGDYSQWFERLIKDPDLAQAAREVEGNSDLPPAESKKQIKEAIESRYTAAA